MTTRTDIHIRPFRETDRSFFKAIAARPAPEPTTSPRDPAGRGLFQRPPRAYIELLAVTEPAAGKGVGRALMDHADRWAQELHCREMVLDVFAENAGAIAFYQRMGYRPDHIRMSKPLVPNVE